VCENCGTHGNIKDLETLIHDMTANETESEEA
jgi:hypothetical protein